MNYYIFPETVHLMYTMCAFETAWNQSTVSPWCKIFSLNDFRVRSLIKIKLSKLSNKRKFIPIENSKSIL